MPNRVAFTSDRDGNREIYVMNPDGSQQINLTNSPGDDANPDWSPDGQHIAFESTRSGQRQIWILNVEAAIAGSEQPTVVTQGDLPKSNPSWMTYVLFEFPFRTEALLYRVLYEGASYLDVAVEEPAQRPPFGSGTTAQQPLTGEPGGDSAPSWNSYGDRLVYRSDRIGASGIASLGMDENGVLTVASLLDTGSPTDTNPELRSDGVDCAGVSPIPPRPGPAKRPPPSGGGAGAGTGNTGSGGPPVPPVRGVSVTAPALSVRAVKVRAVGRRARRRIIVRLTVNRAARATLRLKRGSRSVARRAYQLRRGVNRLTLSVPRRVRRGVYRLTITVRADRTRTVVRRVRLRT